jgi:hypothetical protein
LQISVDGNGRLSLDVFEGLALTLIFTAMFNAYYSLRGKKMKLVTVLLPEAYLEGLDELVRSNMYPSRSSVIRSAVRDLLKKELWENKRGR